MHIGSQPRSLAARRTGRHLEPPRRRVALAAMTLVALAGACGGSTPAPPASDVAASGTLAPATTSPAPRATPLAPTTPVLPPGVTLVTTLHFRPSGIIAVGDEIWAEDHAQTGSFYAFEPETGDVLATIPAGRPCDLAYGYDRLWLIDLDAGSVLVVDPTTRQVVDTIDGDFEFACGPQVGGGAVWFAANPGFARLDAKSGTFAITETGDGTFPAAGVTPSGKSIWGVVYGTAELVKIALRTGKVQLRIAPPGGETEEEPAIVAFDSLWIGNAAAHRVHRADAETGKVSAEIETLPPSRFVATDDGLWYSSYQWGAIGRIDPATNKVVFSATLGGNINGITAGKDAIWAVDTASGKLYRIDPAATGIYE